MDHYLFTNIHNYACHLTRLITSSLLLFVSFSSIAADDSIVSFELDNLQIGYEEQPVVHIELKLNKMRDLHVAIQHADSRQTVKRTMKRIKNSGKYHFSLEIDGVEPGKYRVNAYITPKGKNWNDRIGETRFQVITILDTPKAPKPSVFADKDLIKNVSWPKQINSDGEVILTAKYAITQPRDLHLKLFNSENWDELGALKYPVKTPGEIALPLTDLVTNFGAGKYAWVVYLTAVDSDQEVSKKQGRHFVITSK